MSTMNLKKSQEWNDFELWCDRNNTYPMNLLKNYLRFTVLLNKNLVPKKFQKRRATRRRTEKK